MTTDINSPKIDPYRDIELYRTPLLGGDGSHLTIQQVDTAIRVLAAAYPDFIYNETSGRGCSYHEDSYSKGCIFGQAFQRLGVNMREIPDVGIQVLLGAGCPASWNEVQEDQDTGKSWGEAIEALPSLDGVLNHYRALYQTKLYNHYKFCSEER